MGGRAGRLAPMTPVPSDPRAGLPVPRLTRLGRVDEDVDLHAVALALDAPALVERGDAPLERWHVVPLAPTGFSSVGRIRTRLRFGDDAGEWDERPTPPPDAEPGLSALRAHWIASRTAPPPEDVPFASGLVVLLGYGLAREIERLPDAGERRDDLPTTCAVACAASLLVPVGGGEALFAWSPASLSAADADGWIARCRSVLADPAAAAAGLEPAGRPIGPIEARWSREDHERAVRRIIEELRAGEIYQANLTQRFEVEWEGSALPLHGILRRTNPSPFSGWMRDPEGAWEIVSGSPERLVRRTGVELATEPIAGTAPLPRGRETPTADAARIAAGLVSSAKDHAEHVMIVDLHRNDLGRVSVPGTVRVERMMRLDRRSHVIQAIADIRGRAFELDGPTDVIRGLFPGGCVTGVPKIRAMEILGELEPAARGPYTGSFGLVSGWGDLDLNVLIRSAWRSGGRLAFAAGGGIVLDSDPSAEYRESLAKSQAMREAIEALREATA